MNNDDKKAFADLMAMLSVTYSKEASDALMRSYWLVLNDLDLSELQANATQWMRTQSHFPKPADLRGNDTEALAVDAWRIALQAISRYGGYKSVNFQDRNINATIRSLGGWAAFTEMKLDEEQFWRARFLRTYAAYCRRGASEEAAKPLVGIAEATSVVRNERGEVVKIANVPKEIECDTASRAGQARITEATQ